MASLSLASMGLPGERDEDIIAIGELAERVLQIGREVVPKGQRGGLSVSISVSVFIPKAHTPFQWCGQLDDDEVRRRQKLLLDSVHDRAIRVHYHDAATSLIEAALEADGHASRYHGRVEASGRASMRGRSSSRLTVGSRRRTMQASTCARSHGTRLSSTLGFPGSM